MRRLETFQKHNLPTAILISVVLVAAILGFARCLA